MKLLNDIETKHKELVSKKAKAEAQLELYNASRLELEAQLKELGVKDLNELEELIDQKTEEYERRKADVLVEQGEILKELDDVIAAVKV